MKTIVGLRPTGKLHIGHYFSVIKPALEENADVLIAQFHAPEAGLPEIVEAQSTLVKYGVNSNLQELDPHIYFALLNASKMGELQRLIQYRTAEQKTPHLLAYPVLMAHDLVGYDRVIVGRDQKQHVEYANLLFKRTRMNLIKGDYRAGRIMSLVDPTKKMSKSEPKGCIFLTDTPEEVLQKLLKAPTSSEGIHNLSRIAEYFGTTYDSNRNEESKRFLSSVISSTFPR